MGHLKTIVLLPMILVLTVRVTESRDLRSQMPNTGLLLSALCFQEGQLRKACLEDVSSLSIQRFLDKLTDEIKENEGYETLLRDLGFNDKDEDIRSDDDVLPEKRARPRQASGFYSNW